MSSWQVKDKCYKSMFSRLVNSWMSREIMYFHGGKNQDTKTEFGNTFVIAVLSTKQGMGVVGN